jgi:hypothetical protein
VLSAVVELRQLLRAPRTSTTARLPWCQEVSRAVAQNRRGGWIDLQEAHSGWWRQIFPQRIQCRTWQGDGRSQVMAPWADSFLQGHMPSPQAVGRLERWGAVNWQQELPLAQQGKETVRILFLGFTGTILPRFPMVTDRLAVHQADPIAAAFEPFVARWLGKTGGLHGAPHPLPFVFDQVMPEGLFKAPEARTGMGKCKLATAHGGLGT